MREGGFLNAVVYYGLIIAGIVAFNWLYEIRQRIDYIECPPPVIEYYGPDS